MNRADERRAPERFSLVAGGPFHTLLGRCGLLGPDQLATPRSAVWVALAAWLPPAVLAVIEMLAADSTSAGSFFTDPTVYARYLIATFILLATEPYADRRIGALLRQFRDAELLAADDRERFDAAVVRADRASASVVAEALIGVVAVGFSISTARYIVAVAGVGWEGRLVGGEIVLSPTGLVAALVSNPLFQFLAFRWVWRFLVWTALLFRISRLTLRLSPIHPDRAAGLGFLAIYPGIFSGYVFGMSCVMASSFIKELRFVDHGWEVIAAAIGVWLIFVLVVFVGPLLVFVDRLYSTREAGILEYGRLATRHHHAFQTRWVGDREAGEGILGSPDPSSLADLNASVASVHDMRFAPIDTAAIVQLVAAASLPMIAVVVDQVPLTELLRWMLGAII